MLRAKKRVFGKTAILTQMLRQQLLLILFERSEFLIDTPLKKNLRVCPRARVK